MSNRFFVIADIHGEIDNLTKLMDFVKAEASPDWTTDELVQLGDKNDRGRKTYEVFEYFKRLKDTYPDNIHMILGNHELMMVDACKGISDLLWFNGGNRTLESYQKATGIYRSKPWFHEMLQKSGHWEFLGEHLLFLETEDYFFSHAPIPKEQYRHTPPGTDFRTDRHTLTWSYEDGPTEQWVDPNPVPDLDSGFPGKGKTAVYGHIHGMYEVEGSHGRAVVVPGVRKYGNAVLLDTGSGCSTKGYLSCLELPSMTVYTSKSEKYSLLDTEAPIVAPLTSGIDDSKVNF